MRFQTLALRGFGWLLLAIVLVMALFPPYFMTITAFHPPNLSFSRTPTLFSTDLTLKALARHTMRGLAPPAARNKVQQQLSFDVCKAYEGKVLSVYFTEFLMRFHNTCCNRAGSPCT